MNTVKRAQISEMRGEMKINSRGFSKYPIKFVNDKLK